MGEMDKLKSELSKRENELSLYMRENIRAALAEVPYLAVCAYKQVWEPEILETTITFDKFLANFNNADQPGGGDGQLDLNTGVFTCLTAGHYTISYTASAGNWGDGLVRVHQIYLYLNGQQVVVVVVVVVAVVVVVDGVGVVFRCLVFGCVLVLA